jgi:hypothetical protein
MTTGVPVDLAQLALIATTTMEEATARSRTAAASPVSGR